MAYIDFDPPLPFIVSIMEGKYGLILAHGEKSTYDSGIIKSLSKKLAEKNISCVRFAFPFRVKNTKFNSRSHSVDDAFISAYRQISQKYPNKTWMIGGHGIGAESAVRIGPIVSDIGELPPIICLNYPLYPPNKPERVNMTPLGAIMGEALFCQGTISNRGDFKRLDNSVRMMAEHVFVKPIKGANYDMEVEGKSSERVAFWISNDIERFIKEMGSFM